MITTLLSAVAGGVVAVALALGGVAVATPNPQAPAGGSSQQMLKYGDTGHL